MTMAFNQIREYFPKLSEQLKDHVINDHRLEVPAKTILLREGEVSKKAYIIEKGCVRAWFSNKGKDVTFQFFFEGEGVSSIESFRKKTPSLYSIETVEPCILHWIHKKDWEGILKVISNSPETNAQLMDIMLERQLNYMRQFMSFIRDTPKERYLNLLREKPHIIRRVPQHYIASYLGITPVSLSRIRNAVKK
jgi:CRP-like cAMP-binding protein